MERVTKTFNVYKFEELDKDTQDKLIEKQQEEERNFYCEIELEEESNYIANDILKETFKRDFKDVKALYDLSYCQGGGAMVEYNLDFKDLLIINNFLNEKEIATLKENNFDIELKVKHNSNCHYYHEKSYEYYYISYIDNYDLDDYSLLEIMEMLEIEEEKAKELENIVKKVYNFLNNDLDKFIVEINEELTKRLYNLIEIDNFRDNAIEYLQEHDFLESGEIYE